MIRAGEPVLARPGNELRALLAPITPETFVREYWAQQSLFVKGFPEKYRGLFDRATFDGVLGMAGPFPPDFLRASFDRKTGAGTSAPPSAKDEMMSSVFRAGMSDALRLFDEGATLCISQIETRVPSLVPFLAAIKRQLGSPGRVSFNAYLSPPGSGFNWHFDARIATTLQIEGTKRWRFSRQPAIPWPRGNGSLRADGTPQYSDTKTTVAAWEQLAAFDPADTTEVELEPGDLLVLPAGVWHEACGGSGGSLALNLTFSPLSYTLLVRSVLDALLTPEAAWRCQAPVLPGAIPGEVDPAGVAEITAQLARAGELLSSLRGDSAAVVRAWEAFVQNPTPELPAPYTPPRPTPTTIMPDQRLRVRGDGNVFAMLADGGTRLCVVVGPSRELELTGVAVRFVQRLLAERTFAASECLGWNDGPPFAWNDVRTMLTMLMREGLIEEI